MSVDSNDPIVLLRLVRDAIHNDPMAAQFFDLRLIESIETRVAKAFGS